MTSVLASLFFWLGCYASSFTISSSKLGSLVARLPPSLVLLRDGLKQKILMILFSVWQRPLNIGATLNSSGRGEDDLCIGEMTFFFGSVDSFLTLWTRGRRAFPGVFAETAWLRMLVIPLISEVALSVTNVRRRKPWSVFSKNGNDFLLRSWFDHSSLQCFPGLMIKKRNNWFSLLSKRPRLLTGPPSTPRDAWGMPFWKLRRRGGRVCGWSSLLCGHVLSEVFVVNA